MDRNELIDFMDRLLIINQFQDYAPNGLQIEGVVEVNRIVTSVTASLAAISYAQKMQADMLLVHHGMFWKNEKAIISGWKKQRIQNLIQNDINLVAYHLPLDAHPEVGNNVQLAKQMDWIMELQCGEQNLLSLGVLPQAITLAQLGINIQQRLNRQPLLIGNPEKVIKKIAWCTGGGQGFFQAAIDCKVDAFVTGEVSEAQFHFANESQVAFIAAGHHATERYGIQALANQLNNHYSQSLQISYFDEPNPV